MDAKRALLRAEFAADSLEARIARGYKRNYLAAFFSSCGEDSRALAQFESALREWPREFSYANLRFNFGSVCYRLKQFERALGHFRAALADFPSQPRGKRCPSTLGEAFGAALFNDSEVRGEAFNSVAVCHLCLGRPDRALPYARMALRLRGTPEVWANMGNTLRQLGRRAEAVELAWTEVARRQGAPYAPARITAQPFAGAAAPLTFVCVKWGTKYGAEYANKLFRGVRRHFSRPSDFVCLTDDAVGLDAGVRALPLSAPLSGWWAKAAVFAPGLALGRVAYIDLDVVVVGSLDFLADFACEFAVLGTDSLYCEQLNVGGYNTSIVLFQGLRLRALYEELLRAHDSVRAVIARFDYWVEMLVGGAALVDQLFPGKVIDFNSHAREALPSDASVVVFPCNPKPHEAGAAWVGEHWL